MPSNYPEAFDVFPIPGESDKTTDPGVKHSELHRDLGLAIEAIQATLGINPQGDSATVAEKITEIVTIINSGAEGVTLDQIMELLEDYQLLIPGLSADSGDTSMVTGSPSGSSGNIDIIAQDVTIQGGESITPTDGGVLIRALGITPSESYISVSPSGIELFFDAVDGLLALNTSGRPVTFNQASALGVGALSSTVDSQASPGATCDLDISSTRVFDIVLDEACAISFINAAGDGNEYHFKVYVSGAFSITWTNTIVWAEGVTPTYSSPSLFEFTTIDGTNFFGKMWGAPSGSLVESGTYTPTLTGMAIGTGGGALNTAGYTYVGGQNVGDTGLLTVRGSILFGTSGATFPTAPTFSLPSGFQMPTAEVQFYVGTILYWDADSTDILGLVREQSTTTVNPIVHSTTTHGAGSLSTTSPFTWVAGDAMYYQYAVLVVRV